MFIRIRSPLRASHYFYTFNDTGFVKSDNSSEHETPHTIYCQGFSISTSSCIESMQKVLRNKFKNQLGQVLKRIYQEDKNNRIKLINKISKNKYEIIERHERETEEIFVDIQKESLLNEFIDTLRHEITNPIAGIELAARFISKSTNQCQKEILEISNKIIDSTKKIANLIHQKDQIQSYVLKSFISNIVIEHQQVKSDIDFTIKVPSLLKVNYNPQILEQVFQNLIENATDSCRDNPKSERSIRITAKKISSTIEISVEDNGPSPSSPQKIFSPFYTTKENGVGLGLHICKKLCHALNIKIKFTTTPTKSFILTGKI